MAAATTPSHFQRRAVLRRLETTRCLPFFLRRSRQPRRRLSTRCYGQRRSAAMATPLRHFPSTRQKRSFASTPSFPEKRTGPRIAKQRAEVLQMLKKKYVLALPLLLFITACCSDGLGGGSSLPQQWHL